MRPCFRLAAILFLALIPLPCLSQAAPEKMITREFHMPWDLIHPDWMATPATEKPEADPFDAPSLPRPPVILPPGTKAPLIKSAQEELAEQGVPFPAGASASLDPFHNRLTVTNTAENLELVQGFRHTFTYDPSQQFAFVLTVIQVPGPRMRKLNDAIKSPEDASAILARLMRESSAPASEVLVVGEAFLNAHSGTQAVTQKVLEHHFPASFDQNAKGQFAMGQETLEAGLRLDLMPILDPDCVTIDLTGVLELNPQPPLEDSVHAPAISGPGPLSLPVSRVTALRHEIKSALRSGDTVLIGVGRPAGTLRPEMADVLWASFLTGHRVTLDTRPPLVRAAQPAPAMKCPPGMQVVAFEVPEGMLEHGMESDPTLLQFLERHGVTTAAGAEAHLNGPTLTVVNTPANIERIATLVHRLTEEQPKTVALTLNVVRGEGAFLRNMAMRAASLPDHGGAWAEIERAIADGRHALELVDTLRIETGPDAEIVSLCSVQEHVFPQSYEADKTGTIQPVFDVRDAGISCQFTLGSLVGNTDLTLRLERHWQPPQTVVWPSAAGLATPPMPPITDFHVEQTSTSLCFQNGGVLLVSLARPADFHGSDVLHATFARCDVIPQATKKTPVARRKALPAKHVGPVPAQLYTRSFRVAPDFLSIPASKSTAPFGSAANQRPRKTVQQTLEEAGISFPPGATAQNGNAYAAIVVRNTSENLDKVESFIDELNEKARQLPTALTTQIIEAPAPLVRRLVAGLGSRNDHTPELESLLKAAADGKAHSIGTSRLEAKAGANGLDEQGIRHSFLDDVIWDNKGGVALSHDTRLVGLRNEADLEGRPSDATTVAFRAASEFHASPPAIHNVQLTSPAGKEYILPLTDFHVMKLNTEAILPDGGTRVFAVWKPTGRTGKDGDVLHVMFITCDILRPKQ